MSDPDGPHLLLSGRAYPLDPVTVIGRDEGCELRLLDRDVSRRHAEIRVEGLAVTIRDLHSTNGVWVNDRRITGPTQLISGDVLRVGGHVLAFVTGVTLRDTVETAALEHAAGAPSSDPGGLGESELIEALERASRGMPAPGTAPLARVLLGELGHGAGASPVSAALLMAVARFVIVRGAATRDPRWTGLLFDAVARQKLLLPPDAIALLETAPSAALEPLALTRYIASLEAGARAPEEPLRTLIARLHGVFARTRA